MYRCHQLADFPGSPVDLAALVREKTPGHVDTSAAQPRLVTTTTEHYRHTGTRQTPEPVTQLSSWHGIRHVVLELALVTRLY